MKQTERVLNHMQKYGPITGRMARDLYGIERLAPRIRELKDAGFDICDQTIEGKNRYGEKVHFKEYWIRKPQ